MIVNMTVEIPDWAEYVTIDSDGKVGVWQDEPTSYPADHWTIVGFGAMVYVDKIPPPADWTKELYKVVEGELVRITS